MKNKKTNPLPMLIVVAGGILLLGAAGLLLAQGGSPAPTATPETTGGQDIPYPEIQRIGLKEAKAALDAGTALFVDVRGADVFAVSHVSGALSIPQAEIENRLGELDPEQWIITYCT